MHRAPAQRVAEPVVAEPSVFRPGAGPDGHKATLVIGNQAQVRARAAFAIGHVQKVAVADNPLHKQPGVAMNVVVAGVAVVEFAVDRHGAVGRDGHAVQPLLEIGSVVLVVAQGDARRPVGLLGRSLAGVRAAEGDGGGVLMLLAPVDGQGRDRAEDQGREQAGAIGPVQVIQGAAGPVVVAQGGLTGRKAQGRGDASRRPRGQGVQGLACQQQVGEQNPPDGGPGQGGRAAGQRRQVPLEQTGPVEAIQPEADQRGRTDLQGLQTQTLRQRSRSHDHLATGEPTAARRS